jgi:NAD(P)-dependent dehydrogenase (short-subunit alcohol dehydrogenase family)
MGSRLARKTALLTAAGQGIGKATALAFAAEGAVVYATDINHSALQHLAAECGTIHTRALDVRDEKSIQQAVDEMAKWTYYSTVQATFITEPSWIALRGTGSVLSISM